MDGFVERLAAALAHHDPLRAHDAEARRAAVAVVVADGPEPAILFVKRRERPQDPWSGQMAFPGGLADAADASAEGTARRETKEETGLDLAAARILGRLDDEHPRSVHLPRIIVTPILYTLPATQPVTPGPECAEAVWLPARAVFSKDSRGPYEYRFEGGSRSFDSIRVQGYVIWGLTERILDQIGRLLSL